MRVSEVDQTTVDSNNAVAHGKAKTILDQSTDGKAKTILEMGRVNEDGMGKRKLTGKQTSG